MTSIKNILFLIIAVPMTNGFRSFPNCRRLSIWDRCESCKTGWWGNRCEFTCRGFCDISGCHQNNGSCFGCGAGYYKENCTTPCPDNCHPTYKDNVYCDRVDGECLEGCSRGFWGPRCKEKCSSRCKGGRCYQKDGKCIKACNPGWSWDRCDVPCPAHCAADKDGRKHCHWVTQTCRNGCTHEWWGSHCNKECSSNCISKSCYHVNGYCTEGCRVGWTGDRCDVRCSFGCRDEICVQGGKQECSKGCKIGFHGHHCNKRCNIHCVDRECFHDHLLKTIVCTNGCVEGRWSHNCRKKCPENCGACDKDSGHCFAEMKQPKPSHASTIRPAIGPLSLMTLGCMLL